MRLIVDSLVPIEIAKVLPIAGSCIACKTLDNALRDLSSGVFDNSLMDQLTQIRDMTTTHHLGEWSSHATIKKGRGSHMDISLITGAVSSIKQAAEIGKVLLTIRDTSMVSQEVLKIQELLLKAQESLFSLSAQLIALQQENFNTTEELRKCKETLAERGRYSLFSLSDKFHAYRVNLAPEGTHSISASEPLHYVCQPCFDKGIKSVLHVGEYRAVCPVCKVVGYIKSKPPLRII